MAKKIKNVEETEKVEVIEPDTKVKGDKTVKDNNSKNVKNNKKPKKERRSLGKKFKESASELKKVTWPTFGKTMRQTGVVISVVVICTLVLFGIDRLLGWLYTLLT